MVSPKVIFLIVHALHSRPHTISPFLSLTLPSQGKRVSSSESMDVEVQCGAEI